MISNSVNKYIEEIANKVKKEINIFQKIFLFITQNSSIHYWGFCLYIRNNYIYNNEELMNLNIDPDELSEKILKRIVKYNIKEMSGNTMYLKIDNYTDFELNINRVHRKAKDPDDKWCEVSLKIENEYFKYKTINDEILLEYEIEYLIKELDKMLNRDLKQNEHIDFIEPDLEFTLCPSRQDYEESTVDIRINLFQDGALSADYYNLCLGEGEIKQLLIYLNKIIPTIKLKKREKKQKYTNDDNYCIVSVKYCDYDGDKTYDYILSKDIENTDIGDKVLVDRAGNETLAEIVNKGFYNKSNANYPINMTKEVIEVIKDDIENRRRKVPKCPNCNNDLVDILYGFPIGEAFRKAERKEIYLGGCVKFDGFQQPIYHCYTCSRSYFEDLKEYIETKNFLEEINDTENMIDNGEDE